MPKPDIVPTERLEEIIQVEDFVSKVEPSIEKYTKFMRWMTEEMSHGAYENLAETIDTDPETARDALQTLEWEVKLLNEIDAEIKKINSDYDLYEAFAAYYYRLGNLKPQEKVNQEIGDIIEKVTLVLKNIYAGFETKILFRDTLGTISEIAKFFETTIPGIDAKTKKMAVSLKNVALNKYTAHIRWALSVELNVLVMDAKNEGCSKKEARERVTHLAEKFSGDWDIELQFIEEFNYDKKIIELETERMELFTKELFSLTFRLLTFKDDLPEQPSDDKDKEPSDDDKDKDPEPLPANFFPPEIVGTWLTGLERAMREVHFDKIHPADTRQRFHMHDSDEKQRLIKYLEDFPYPLYFLFWGVIGNIRKGIRPGSFSASKTYGDIEKYVISRTKNETLIKAATWTSYVHFFNALYFTGWPSSPEKTTLPTKTASLMTTEKALINNLSGSFNEKKFEDETVQTIGNFFSKCGYTEELSVSDKEKLYTIITDNKKDLEGYNKAYKNFMKSMLFLIEKLPRKVQEAGRKFNAVNEKSEQVQSAFDAFLKSNKRTEADAYHEFEKEHIEVITEMRKIEQEFVLIEAEAASLFEESRKKALVVCDEGKHLWSKSSGLNTEEQVAAYALFVGPYLRIAVSALIFLHIVVAKQYKIVYGPVLSFRKAFSSTISFLTKR